MSSRQQEKERRRQEREAAEAAAARAESRKRTLRIGGGALIAAAVIAVVAVIALSGGDGGGGEEVSAADLTASATAAGCTFKSYPSEGRDHTSEKNVRYKTNPPTSGPHNPVAAQDGIYAPGNEPAPENWVHSLEHGRILFQYKPGTSAADVSRLRALMQEEVNGSAAYHALLFQNNTDMPTQFALVGWTKSLTCKDLTAKSQDVMRQFRAAYTDKGPEFIP